MSNCTSDILLLTKWVHFISSFVVIIVRHSSCETPRNVILVHKCATKALFWTNMFRFNFPPPT